MAMVRWEKNENKGTFSAVPGLPMRFGQGKRKRCGAMALL